MSRQPEPGHWQRSVTIITIGANWLIEPISDRNRSFSMNELLKTDELGIQYFPTEIAAGSGCRRQPRLESHFVPAASEGLKRAFVVENPRSEWS